MFRLSRLVYKLELSAAMTVTLLLSSVMASVATRTVSSPVSVPVVTTDQVAGDGDGVNGTAAPGDGDGIMGVHAPGDGDGVGGMVTPGDNDGVSGFVPRNPGLFRGSALMSGNGVGGFELAIALVILRIGVCQQ